MQAGDWLSDLGYVYQHNNVTLSWAWLTICIFSMLYVAWLSLEPTYLAYSQILIADPQQSYARATYFQMPAFSAVDVQLLAKLWVNF
jgi:hypothetical protein